MEWGQGNWRANLLVDKSQKVLVFNVTFFWKERVMFLPVVDVKEWTKPQNSRRGVKEWIKETLERKDQRKRKNTTRGREERKWRKEGNNNGRKGRDTHRRNLENERSLHVVRIEFVANTSLLDSYYCAWGVLRGGTYATPTRTLRPPFSGSNPGWTDYSFDRCIWSI